MAYKVLARKWRPQQFADLIGQEAVQRALINALDSDRLHHAYLFTGMRGVGKTTIARIFAKCLNCERQGVSSRPCGECSACTDIEAGRFLDLIEVDAASRTKVDETRELLDNVPYAPASGRYKVYLIDEVHMFSTHSFNALLKTLEEPPEHVKFLLATTDPQKVPVTVLSRCLQFNLKRLPVVRLADHLAHILDAESIEHEREALELIARAAEGSVRDALSLVEQAAAHGGERVLRNEVESMLGRVSIDRLLDLIEWLLQGDLEALFAGVDALAEYAPDFDQLLAELLALLHRLALVQSLPGSLELELPSDERLKTLAGEIPADSLQLFYQIAQHARRDLPFSPDPRDAFDMALLRMHAFQPQTAAEPTRNATASKTASETTSETTSETAVTRPATSRASSPANTTADASPDESAKGSASRPSTPMPSRPEPSRPQASRPQASGPEASGPEASGPEPQAAGRGLALHPSTWPDTVNRLELSGMPRQLARHCVLAKVEGDRATLVLDADAEHLKTRRFVERLQTALGEFTGQALTLDIQLAEASVDTPAAIDDRNEADTLAAARAAIDEDPTVQRLLASVDGEFDAASVRPRKP